MANPAFLKHSSAVTFFLAAMISARADLSFSSFFRRNLSPMVDPMTSGASFFTTNLLNVSTISLKFAVRLRFARNPRVRYRKLEVILTTGIEKLGKAGETVKVAPRYFRNHLMPKLLAVPNIDKYAYLIREQRKMYNHEEDKEEVKVVHKTSEVQTKEYEKAAKRLAAR
ncbi:Ribosomal protein L9/RNase H1 N-terminal [Arabidopsis thaliana x Arabidopsis arenosa]|uniref:Ribosomal protein L9/RNase H1 N-terminal n=1 Tax=Arabidopsis thaliana x Arabidopsis arenosa TaxID=1240361 RepID=A0A8T1XFL7_9BRAS|nr:Ribosomal protein L9/RNase H1 N-terminal [Arabidopsis thaliana x Arabidopsis arenosa]